MNALRVAAILILAASGSVFHARLMAASGSSEAQPLVRGISVHQGPDGAATIDVAITRTVSFRTMHLSGPNRLVVDLQGTREENLRDEYPAESPLLQRVRVGQWRTNPAVVRVVADLKGNPAFSVNQQATGMQIVLKPGAAENAPAHDPAPAKTEPAGSHYVKTAQEGPLPKTMFPVHRFKDLSASLTAPVLPPHDKLVAVAKADAGGSGELAEVSGISIKPNDKGETIIDIASTRSVPYRVFQLTDPFRLVIDVRDARDASGKDVYPVNSAVLKRIRVSQWQPGDSPVVRVVADLEGYPVFDVHAQRPGIRIELMPRQAAQYPARNPFEFAGQAPSRHAGRSPEHPGRVLKAAAISPAPAPANEFSNLRVIGFIEKNSGTQAVISDQAKIYLVPKGGTFAKTYTVLTISPSAVQVQNSTTHAMGWIPYIP